MVVCASRHSFTRVLKARVIGPRQSNSGRLERDTLDTENPLHLCANENIVLISSRLKAKMTRTGKTSKTDAPGDFY